MDRFESSFNLRYLFNRKFLLEKVISRKKKEHQKTSENSMEIAEKPENICNPEKHESPNHEKYLGTVDEGSILKIVKNGFA